MSSYGYSNAERVGNICHAFSRACDRDASGICTGHNVDTSQRIGTALYAGFDPFSTRERFRYLPGTI